MSRKTGMIISTKSFKSVLRFSGYFQCRNEAGNRRLRDMEPPRHDEWNPDLPEKGANRAVNKELIEWIRTCISTLSPIAPNEVVSLPDLYRYLPDDEEGPEDEPFESGADTRGESLHENPPVETAVPIRPIKATASVSNGRLPAEDTDETDEPEESEGHGRNKKKKKEEKDEGEEEVGKPANVHFRSFLLDEQSFTYRLTCHPTKSGECTLVVRAVGDDASAEPIELIRANSADNKKALPIKDANKILNVRMQRNAPTSLDVQLASKLRCALEISAYEV